MNSIDPPGTRCRTRALMRRAAVLLATLALIAFAGCGDQKELTSSTSAALLSALDAATSSYDARSCEQARSDAAQLSTEVSTLDNKIDRKLRTSLRSSVAQLQSLIDTQCSEAPVAEPLVTDTATPPVTETDNGKKNKGNNGNGNGNGPPDNSQPAPEPVPTPDDGTVDGDPAPNSGGVSPDGVIVIRRVAR